MRSGRLWRVWILAGLTVLGMVLIHRKLSRVAPPATTAVEYSRPVAASAAAKTDDYEDGWEIPRGSTAEERAYLGRAVALRKEAFRSGRVSYAQVLQAAYPPGVVTPQVLARKAAYRNRISARIPFLADYYSMRETAEVSHTLVLRDPLTREELRGSYSGALNRITIARAWPRMAVTLYHETGHALQRHDHQPLIFDDLVFAAHAACRIDMADSNHARYLTGLKELEISLQDLNRFNGNFVTGRPIMTPEDALRALHALGLIVTWNETRTAFAAESRPLTYNAYLKLWEHPGNLERSLYAFPSAERLVGLRDVARRTDLGLWPALLHYLIFAAPGHL